MKATKFLGERKILHTIVYLETLFNKNPYHK